MLKKIISNISSFIVFMSFTLFLGCDGPKDKSWIFFKETIEKDAGKTPEISDEEIIKKFNDNVIALSKAITLCEQNPDIRKVSIKDVSYYKVASSSSVSIGDAVSSMRDIIHTASIFSIECGRRGDYEGNPLASVTFVVYASGVSVSGRLKSIDYLTEWQMNKGPIAEGKASDLGLKNLPVTGWYIFDSLRVKK